MLCPCNHLVFKHCVIFQLPLHARPIATGLALGFCICLVTLTALVRFLPRAAKTGDVMLRHILFKRIALVLYVYVYTNAILLQRKFKASSWPECLFTNVLAD